MKPITLRDAEARTLAETGECVIERPVKPQPTYYSGTVWSWRFPKRDSHGVSGITGSAEGLALALREYSPLGQPGEQRWVREKWCLEDEGYQHGVLWLAIHYLGGQVLYIRRKDSMRRATVGKLWWPAITMPRWASRFTVEVLSTEAIQRGGVWYWNARVRRVSDA